MSKKIGYFSYGNATDGTNYCSGIETLVDNVIEDSEQDAQIVFPSKDGWAAVRSESYRVTTNTAAAILPYPIYKLCRILVKPDNFFIKNAVAPASPIIGYFNNFKNSNGESIAYLDITKYVLQAEEWESLKNASSKHAYRQEGVYKDNTFYWKQSENNIPFLGTEYRIGSSFLGGIFADNTPTYNRLLMSALYDIKNPSEWKDSVYGTTLNAILVNGEEFDDFISLDTDVRKWQFRIEYIPMTSATKLRVWKNADTEVDYFQSYNQRAETNSAYALGKNMYYTAQKTGGRRLSVAKNYKKLSDVPPLGAIVNHNKRRYRIVSNQYKMSNTIYVQVIHTLSENWTSKSKHVGVDQKYRNWDIPFNFVWRNLYWEEFAHASFLEPKAENVDITGARVSQITNVFSVMDSNDLPIAQFFWRFTNENLEEKVCVLPCTAAGIGNSLVLTAAFKDNYSAGLSRNLGNYGYDYNISSGEWGSEYGLGEYCEEVAYCQSNGTLEKATVIFSNGIANTTKDGGLVAENRKEIIDILAQNVYPHANYSRSIGDGNEPFETYILNLPAAELFKETFYIKKDRSEALKFTYQIHFIQDDERIIFGDLLFANNALIKHTDRNNQSYRLVLSKTYFREGDNVVDLDKTENVTATPSREILYVLQDGITTPYASKIGLTDAQFTKLGDNADYVAWAITDVNGKLYMACNDKTQQYIYFWISDKK